MLSHGSNFLVENEVSLVTLDDIIYCRDYEITKVLIKTAMDTNLSMIERQMAERVLNSAFPNVESTDELLDVFHDRTFIRERKNFYSDKIYSKYGDKIFDCKFSTFAEGMRSILVSNQYNTSIKLVYENDTDLLALQLLFGDDFEKCKNKFVPLEVAYKDVACEDYIFIWYTSNEDVHIETSKFYNNVMLRPSHIKYITRHDVFVTTFDVWIK